jgi:hypothetical protein
VKSVVESRMGFVLCQLGAMERYREDSKGDGALQSLQSFYTVGGRAGFGVVPLICSVASCEVLGAVRECGVRVRGTVASEQAKLDLHPTKSTPSNCCYSH